MPYIHSLSGKLDHWFVRAPNLDWLISGKRYPPAPTSSRPTPGSDIPGSTIIIAGIVYHWHCRALNYHFRSAKIFILNPSTYVQALLQLQGNLVKKEKVLGQVIEEREQVDAGVIVIIRCKGQATSGNSQRFWNFFLFNPIRFNPIQFLTNWETQIFHFPWINLIFDSLSTWCWLRKLPLI